MTKTGLPIYVCSGNGFGKCAWHVVIACVVVKQPLDHGCVDVSCNLSRTSHSGLFRVCYTETTLNKCPTKRRINDPKSDERSGSTRSVICQHEEKRSEESSVGKE